LTETIRQILFVPPAPLAWLPRVGGFESEDLSVETTQTASSDEMGQGLADGRWDIGIAVVDNVIAWNAAYGADAQIIAQLERHIDLRFVAPVADRTMADVARHPIAVDATSNGFVLVLYRALAREGIDWRSCVFEPLGGVRHRFEALMEGRARATILIPPFDTMAQAKGFHTLWTRETMAPRYPGMVVAARRKWLAERPDAAVRYLRALLRAQAWALDPANRENAVAVLKASRYPDEMAARLIAEPVTDLQPAHDGWQETMDLRREAGLQIAPEPAPAQAIDLTPLQQALASLDAKTRSA
jgi:ABC-type nitrate/sulfonate/bicarbonate transport system substrate-binding protein